MYSERWHPFSLELPLDTWGPNTNLPHKPTGPYLGLTRKGSLIGSGGGGGGDVRHRRSVDLEGSGGMLLQNFFL